MLPPGSWESTGVFFVFFFAPVDFFWARWHIEKYHLERSLQLDHVFFFFLMVSSVAVN